MKKQEQGATPQAGWLMLNKSILPVKQLKNNRTGIEVEWTHDHTILWLYMLDRYNFFKKQGGSFYDNTIQISTTTGIQPRTLTRRLKDLCDVGLVEITKIKLPHHVGYQRSNSYVVHDIVDNLLFSTGDVKVIKVPTTKQTPKPKQNKHITPEEEEQCPF
jgi:hypothetical protein